MLATPAGAVPAGSAWAVELKYDGIRVIAWATPETTALLTRLGNDRSRQFPEVAAALSDLSRTVRRPLILDGEIVPLGPDGRVGRFQDLQGRMHLQRPAAIALAASEMPATFVAFDILLDGDTQLITEPWSARRHALRKVLARARSPHVQLGEAIVGDAAPLMARAQAEGWEGLMAKRVDAPYEPGRRSRAWRKIKLERRQEFVVGGFTAPRGGRLHLGALLVGVYEGRGRSARLVPAGRVGTGFTRADLAHLERLLAPLVRETSPFAAPVAAGAGETVTWVEPALVIEARFNEWTAGGVLRQPVFVGLRDDKDPLRVRREPQPIVAGSSLDADDPSDAPPPAGQARRPTRPRSIGRHV